MPQPLTPIISPQMVCDSTRWNESALHLNMAEVDDDAAATMAELDSGASGHGGGTRRRRGHGGMS